MNKGKLNCFSEETLKNLSNSLKELYKNKPSGMTGKIPWNKGIHWKKKNK